MKVQPIEVTDYFEHYNLVPKKVKAIIMEYKDEDNSYENCEKLIKALNEVGWTCDYGLDASPYDLKPID